MQWEKIVHRSETKQKHKMEHAIPREMETIEGEGKRERGSRKHSFEFR